MKRISTLLLIFRSLIHPGPSKFSCLTTVLAATLFFSCASASGPIPANHPSISPIRGTKQQIQIRSSHFDARPVWTRYTSYEKNGFIYFTGSHLNGVNYPLSVRCAVSEAMKVLVMSLSQSPSQVSASPATRELE